MPSPLGVGFCIRPVHSLDVTGRTDTKASKTWVSRPTKETKTIHRNNCKGNKNMDNETKETVFQVAIATILLILRKIFGTKRGK